jgi:nucleoside 2-deoxyribosyltransferase
MNAVLTIVGGFYRERCRFPQADEMWGSGGRAAAAIADLGVETSLLTAADAKAERQLLSIAHVFRFRTAVERIPETLTFHYDHPLSAPVIWPLAHHLSKVAIRAEAPCILQFGMLDAAVSPSADTLVYDPQEPFSPQPVSILTKPSRLAYVLNSTEARRLGADDDVTKAAAGIAVRLGAHVVVVKQGARGALVWDAGKAEQVPAYETRTVWPIGSGDVFAAVFAACWAVHGRSSVEAADSASRAAAFYVQSRVLPVPREVIYGNEEMSPLRLLHHAALEGEYDVYLAGPFFNMAQLWLVEEARLSLLGMGLKVFSPYHDVGPGDGMVVAPKDVEALKRSRAVLALIDGVDAGTIFEVGYARAIGKPVVAFVQSTPDEPLKMICGTGCEIVDDFVTAIYRTAWASWK